MLCNRIIKLIVKEDRQELAYLSVHQIPDLVSANARLVSNRPRSPQLENNHLYMCILITYQIYISPFLGWSLYSLYTE